MSKIHEAIYVIEWRNRGSDWRYWSMRFTERACRLWIESEKSVRPQMEYRVVEYMRINCTAS
jgi:hypothetical protein